MYNDSRARKHTEEQQGGLPVALKLMLGFLALAVIVLLLKFNGVL